MALQESLTSETDYNEAGAQLRPDANGGSILTALGVADQARGNILARLGGNGGASQGVSSGISSGDEGYNSSIWASGFGSYAEQDTISEVDGFKADIYGSSLGVDKEINDNIKVGAAFTYANSSVDDQGARAGSGEEIDSYVGNIYGGYNFNPWYADVILTLAHHEYDTTRLVNFSGNTIASASFSSIQYGAKTEVGYPIQFSNYTFTPLAGFSYDRINQDGYTETGAGGANLVVDDSEVDSYRGNLGIKASALYDLCPEWKFKPSAELSYIHEFNDSIIPNQSVSFEAGGVSFITPGLDLPQDAVAYGAGVELISSQGFTMNAQYNGEYRSNYISNSFALRGKLDF